MKIIALKAGGIVLYAGDGVGLGTSGALSQSGSVDAGTTTANATLVDNVTLPGGWIGGAWSYVAGVWTLVNPPPMPPVEVPQSVTMRQARLALLAHGLLATVDTVINALPEPQQGAARIEWDYSSTVERDRPFVKLLGPALGLDSEHLDGLFIEAAAL